MRIQPTLAGGPPVSYAAGKEPSSVRGVDLDGDGAIDLAVTNWNTNNVTVLENTGDGTFAAAVDYGVGNGPNCVSAADLVTANEGGDNASVLLNRTIPPQCVCDNFCVLNLDGAINPGDVVCMVSFVYTQIDLRRQIPTCPGDNGDWDCNGNVNPLDVVKYVNFVFKPSGQEPCDPCTQPKR